MAEFPKTPGHGKSVPASAEPVAAPPGRRNLLAAFVASVVGVVLMIFPFAAGGMVFLDPLLRRKGAQDGVDKKPGKWLRITSVAAVPASGAPAQFPVIDDLVDAWNRQPDQPVGAVYLRRLTSGGGSDGADNGANNGSGAQIMIQAFNAICPHEGCFVAFASNSQSYKCPCHNSSFNLDGSKIKVEGVINPAPRPMDELEVDQQRVDEGEVWVRFLNFLPNKATQEPK
jgi:Rieske Fe-S protein